MATTKHTQLTHTLITRKHRYLCIMGFGYKFSFYVKKKKTKKKEENAMNYM